MRDQDQLLFGLKSGFHLIQQLSLMLVGLFTVFVVWLLLMVGMQLQRIPDLAFLEHYHPINSVEIYDNNDKLVCAINREENHELVPLNKISLSMQQAALAAEDRRFFSHHGLSLTGMFRAMFANMHAGHVVEGGSTITQQLVKNLFFCRGERTLVRKIAEAVVAYQIESRFTKPQILCMYLNQIYFGNGAHGIDQAAKHYFGKTPAYLDIHEAAFLAGLIRAPSVLGTFTHREEALARQKEIIDGMVTCGFINERQALWAKNMPFDLHISPQEEKSNKHPFNVYPYYVSYVLDIINQCYDENYIRQGGLRVYTNLDQVAQRTAESVLAREIRLAPRGIDQEALVSIAIKDGAIRAIVGGAGNYWTSQWNCATNPHTVGSAFKPFVYLAGFIKDDFRPDSIIEDAPITVNQIDMKYTPKNYDGKYMGKITVREALAKSRNTCAIRAAQKEGMDSIAEVARLAGIKSDLERNLSLALGSCAVSPLEMATAYGTFARGGIRIDPRAIRRVEDLHGNVISTSEPVPCRVLPEEQVAWLVDVLKDVVTNGTGTQARLGSRPVAGKTGTADQGRDLWFIGFTPDMVTAVWGGNMQNNPIKDKHVTGGTVMARIWRQYNASYYARCPTPAGTLIASKYAGELKATHEHNYSYTTHYSSSHSSASAPPSTYAPTNGIILRSGKGITDYAWTR